MKLFRTTVVASAAAYLLGAASAWAASPIDGTWRNDLATAQMSKRPDTVTLKDGVYACSTCIPPFSVTADGAFHPLTAIPGVDEMSVRVIDAATVERVERLNGREVWRATATLSPNGRVLAISGVETDNPGAAPAKIAYNLKRVGPAASGAHPTSGSFVMDTFGAVDENAIVTTYKLTGDTLQASSPLGYGFSAKVNGPDAPVIGDPETTTMAVTMVGDSKLVLTGKYKGDVTNVSTVTLSPDGRTMDVKVDDRKYHTTYAYTAHKL